MRVLLCLWLFVASGAAVAQNAFLQWVETDLWQAARAAGVSQKTFDSVMSGVRPNPDLPGLRNQGGQQTQAEFRYPSRYFREGDLRANAQIGAQHYRSQASTLAQIEQRTGVPGHILLAIWGRESSFGRASIPHDAFEVLASRAFLGRRGAYFQAELVAALQMVDQGLVQPSQMRSSWAGALGQPQFMPSSYLRYALDGDGNGTRDIWGSEADTLASIANYLQRHGWQRGRDWGFEVNIPSSVPCHLEGPDQGRRISEWERMGITRANGRAFPEAERGGQGFLLMPAGRGGPAFIVTPNFYVLKEYNESDAYALFVGHVGDRIAYGVPAFRGAWGRGDTLTVSQVRAMQQRLVSLGYDVGGVDGLVGFKTRRSIGQWQAANGLAATCYPSRAVVQALN